MQKITKITKLLCVMLVLMLCFNERSSAKQSEIGQIKGNNVNLRVGPSLDDTAIATLNAGDMVEELDKVTNDDGEEWTYVVCNDQWGYVRSDNILMRTVSDRIGFVKEDDVNLRGGPSKSAYLITKMQGGHKLRIKQMVGEWYYVSYNGEEGFVFRDMIEISGSLVNTDSEGYDVLLKFGMEGSEVLKLQQTLLSRNFLSKESAVDGVYGDGTRKAVKEFQKMAGMEQADGTAGPDTLALLYDSSFVLKKPPTIPQTLSDLKGRVVEIDWWNGGNKVLKRPGGVATVFDVSTGKKFKIRRTGGTNHNDVVPYSAEDTSIMKSIVGHWSWARRSIVVVTSDGKAYAASMNCMPHSPDPQPNDNFPGHFCIHFTNSRTHGGNKVDPDHAAAIQYALKKFG